MKAYNYKVFDRSKFTVVGNPTITDDGVIKAKTSYISAGVAPNNAIFIPNSILKQIGTKNWSLEWEGKFLNTPVAGEFVIGSYWSETNASPLTIGNFNINPTLFWSLNLNNGGSVIKSANQNTAYQNRRNGESYKGKFEFKNGRYSLTLYFEDGTNAESHLDSDLYFEPSTYNLGLGLNIQQDFDLKQFRLCIDGVEVFNGTRDAYKLYSYPVFDRNKFSTYGSPAITDDGIVNTTTTDFLWFKNGPIKPELKDFYFELEFEKLQDYPTSAYIPIGGANDIRRGNFQLYVWNFQIILTVFFENNGEITRKETGIITPITNSKHKCSFERQGNLFTIKYDNQVKTFESSLPVASTGITNQIIGQTLNGEYNKLDLKSFNFVVDGIEVFNGTKPAYKAFNI